jgi:hypothetical protein
MGSTKFRRIFCCIFARPFRQIAPTLADRRLSNRSIELTGTLRPLAGVLLGKTSLNSLYGANGWAAANLANRFGPCPALAAAPYDKICCFSEV